MNATTVAPVGGTPTAATLTALKPELEGFAGLTFVILATDGGANCDPNAVCDVDTCTANLDGVTITQKTDAGTAAVVCQPLTPPNCCVPPPLGAGNLDCLDTQATTAAVAALKAAGIPVYVVGILGSAPYETMLDGLAQAGGTARATAPYYYRVDTADAQALTTALSEIAAKITGVVHGHARRRAQRPGERHGLAGRQGPRARPDERLDHHRDDAEPERLVVPGAPERAEVRTRRRRRLQLRASERAVTWRA